MKNVKRLVAILTTAVLCMGMGMSALASQDYPNDELWSPDVLPTGNIEKVVDSNGNQVEYTERELSVKTKKALSDESKVREIFEKCGFDVDANMDFVPIYTGDISVSGGGLAMAVFSAESEGLYSGDSVYALRETAPGSGVFEAYTGEVVNGEIRFNIQGSAGYVLVKVMSDGSVVSLDKNTGIPVDTKTGLTVDHEVAENEDNKVTLTNSTKVVGKDANGEDIVTDTGIRVSKLDSQIEQLITENFETIFNAEYQYPKNENSSIEVVYKGEFTRKDENETGTVRMYFSVTDEEENVYYYALHGITNADGQVEWEILECRKDEQTGEMYFELDSFSPVAIIKVMSDQKPALIVPEDPSKPSKPSKPGTGGSSSSTTKNPGSSTQQEMTTQLGTTEQSGTTVQLSSSEKTSPKTGEF